MPTPIATDSVAWEGFGDVPNYRSRWRHLTRAAWGPDYRIGVVIEELPPGGKSAPFHYHFAEEEHVYVLDGTPTLRLGETTPPHGPGRLRLSSRPGSGRVTASSTRPTRPSASW